MNNHSRKGFTYIELIITVAILSFISVTVAVVTKNLFIRARDTKRIQIMRDTQFALQFYYLRNYNYGDSLNDFCTLISELVNRNYLPYVPKDPRAKVNVCVSYLDGNPSVGGAMYVYEATPSSGIASSFLLKLVKESGGVLTWTSI